MALYSSSMITNPLEATREIIDPSAFERLMSLRSIFNKTKSGCDHHDVQTELGLQSDRPLLRKVFIREVARRERILNGNGVILSESKSTSSMLRKLTARAIGKENLIEIPPIMRRDYRFILSEIVYSTVRARLSSARVWLDDETIRFSHRSNGRITTPWESPEGLLLASVLRPEEGELLRVSINPDTSLEELERSRLNLVERVEKLFKVKDRVFMLDLGCAAGLALYQLKEQFGDRIFTCGISVSEEPHFDVDLYLHRGFENLPRECAGKFDIVWSYYGLDYAVLPHFALRTAASLLNQGGELFVYRASVNPLAYTQRSITGPALGRLYAQAFSLLREETSDAGWRKHFSNCIMYLEESSEFIRLNPEIADNIEFQSMLRTFAEAFWIFAHEQLLAEGFSISLDDEPIFDSTLIPMGARRWVCFKK